MVGYGPLYFRCNPIIPILPSIPSAVLFSVLRISSSNFSSFSCRLSLLVWSWPTINIRPHIMHFRRLAFSYTEVIY